MRMTGSFFTDWAGGDRPHAPGTYVEVRLRDGKVVRATSAFVQWWHGSEPSPGDVVAYRELPPEADDGTMARLALKRLRGGDDPMLARIERVILDCPKRGDFGGLAVGEFPASGRVMVPTEVLNDLLAVARGANSC